MSFQCSVLISLGITVFLWYLIIYVVIDRFVTGEKNLLSSKKSCFLTGITVLSIFLVVFCVTVSTVSNGFIGQEDTGIQVLYNFGGIFGAIATSVAVWVAVLIPKKIAEEQNMIALFEKRAKIHAIVYELTSIANNLGFHTSWILAIKTLREQYSKTIPYSTKDDEFLSRLRNHVNDNYYSLKNEVYFLFDLDIMNDFDSLVSSFLCSLDKMLLTSKNDNGNPKDFEIIEKFDQFVTDAKGEHLYRIKDSLILTDRRKK